MTINEAMKYPFCAWYAENGHKHTMKAFDQEIEWIGGNQQKYARHVEKKENTRILKIRIAKTEQEAARKDIIYYEDGQAMYY